jgi:hypothetical protein
MKVFLWSIVVLFTIIGLLLLVEDLESRQWLNQTVQR